MFEMSSEQSTLPQVNFLKDRAKMVRLETVRLSRIAGAGHYSSTFSAAEMLVALYYDFLEIDPSNPDWVERDRFILSKGHAAIGLYPILADLGFFETSLLDDYTRLGSAFGDHPDMKKISGIDFSSGSLGHGLSIAVGIALGARVLNRNYRVCFMMGDGELHEGQIWEATMAAGHFQLNNIIGIIDRNQLCIDGSTEQIMTLEPLEKRFDSFGWEVFRINGHNFTDILTTLNQCKTGSKEKPKMIISDTVKGRGIKMMEGSLDWHVGNLVGTDYDSVISELERGLGGKDVI